MRPGSAEWDHVQRSLTRSLRTAQVTDIQRVQNKWLYRKYAIQRHLMKDKNGEYSQFSINLQPFRESKWSLKGTVSIFLYFRHKFAKFMLKCSSHWRCSGLVVRALDFRSGGLWLEPSLCRRVVSLDKKLYSILSLFTQVYKWVPAIIMLGVTLRWTSIRPSRGE